MSKKEIIYESDVGAIEFTGIKQSKQSDTIDVFVSYTGDYSEINRSLDFSLNIILSNGDKISGAFESERKYDDKSIEMYQFYSYGEFSIDDIVRVDVNIPMVQEKDLEIFLDNMDENKTTEIKGIESIKEVHRPDWGFKEKEYEIVIDKLLVEQYGVEISGVIKPAKDMSISESSTAYLPFSNSRCNIAYGIFGSDSEMDISKGTEKEFELKHSFAEPISEFNHELRLTMYGHEVFVDLLDGTLIDEADGVSITQFKGNRNGEYIGFDDSEQKELFNQSDKRVAIDSILLSSTYGDSNTYDIGNKYKKFETTVHVHKDFSGVDYGTTELKILVGKGGKEEEVYSKEIEEDQKPLGVSVDVKGADYLMIKTSPNYGDKGVQKLILESPIVK